MSDTIFPKLLNAKSGTKCMLCDGIHVPQFKCNPDAMAKKITRLLEANSLIPSLMAANKQAVETARGFQVIIKRFDEAHTILMQVLSTHGEIGAKIEQEYMERLDKWAKAREISNPDTSEQMELFDQNKSTSNETETKPSTNPSSGQDSVQDSSPKTLAAIVAEKMQKQSTTLNRQKDV